jgi:hypothetical protein
MMDADARHFRRRCRAHAPRAYPTLEDGRRQSPVVSGVTMILTCHHDTCTTRAVPAEPEPPDSPYFPESALKLNVYCRFVPEGHPNVFDVTKRKIHNVLQGVAARGIEMSDKDKEWFEIWIEQNCACSGRTVEWCPRRISFARESRRFQDNAMDSPCGV